MVCKDIVSKTKLRSAPFVQHEKPVHKTRNSIISDGVGNGYGLAFPVRIKTVFLKMVGFQHQ